MSRVAKAFRGLFLGLCAAGLAGRSEAAFEAPPPDPAALALGGSVAWPGAGRAAGGGVALFDGGAPPQLRLTALQWAEAPELQRQGVALAYPLRGLEIGLSGERLAMAGYSEAVGLLAVARPVAESGWGGGVGIGVARWGPPGAETKVFPLVVQIGAAPRAGLRLGGSLRTALGSGARRLEERLDAGLTWDAAPGWRIGAGCEARAAGTRVRAALECRPGSGLALRGAFSPGDGAAAFGMGVTLGGFVLDLAQSRHPRLGALLAAGLSLRWGRGAVGAAPEPGATPSPEPPESAEPDAPPRRLSRPGR